MHLLKVVLIFGFTIVSLHSAKNPQTMGVEKIKGGEEVKVVGEISNDPQVSMDEEEDDEEEDDEEDFGCTDVFCKTGRVCEETEDGSARCVCGSEGHCKGHSRKVCGSDGRLYPSHCELHRVSCVEGSRLGVDPSNKRCASTDAVKNTPAIRAKLSTIVMAVTVLKSSLKDHHTSVSPTTKRPNHTTTTPTKTTLYKTTQSPHAVCTPTDYNDFKDKLMAFQCQRSQQSGCMQDERRKPLEVTELFDFLDKDENKLLTLTEMQATGDSMQSFSSSCGMEDLFMFDDIDEDDIINIEEFYRAFGVYDSGLAEDSPVTFTTLVTVGNALELKCDLPGSDKVIWKRIGVVLEHSDEIKIFDDNSLYIGDLQLHHMGNYSCHDSNIPSLFQRHVIIVQMPPSVTVFPTFQMLPCHSMATLKCHVDSVPQSEVSWSRDGKVISTDLDPNNPIHYFLLESNTTLKVRSNVSDVGEYTCDVKNSAGSSHKTVSVSFMQEATDEKEMNLHNTERFVAFHADGYTTYDVTKCKIQQQISTGFQIILPTISTALCRSKCEWGGATLVGEELIYVNQPTSKRVLVVEVVDQVNTIEVIKLEEAPVEIAYVPHLDQVWLTLCEDGKEECDEKVVRVVNRASRSIQHQTIALKNKQKALLKISLLFVPKGENRLNEKFNNGYYSTRSEKGVLFVVDLISMETTGRVDLMEHDCEPVDLAFVPIGGYLFISCQKMAPSTDAKSHLIVDYITHKVVQKADVGGGNVFVSPDSRNVVVLEESGNAFSVYKLTADGRLNHLFDEYTEMHLSHISFFESGNGYGYNAFAVCFKFNTVLHLDLTVGKVTMIEGPEGLFSKNDISWNRRRRKLIGGRLFMGSMATSCMQSLTSMEGRSKSVTCHWQGVNNSSAILPLPLQQGGLKY